MSLGGWTDEGLYQHSFEARRNPFPLASPSLAASIKVPKVHVYVPREITRRRNAALC